LTFIFKEAWHHNRCTSGEAHIVPAEEIGLHYEKAAENRVGSSMPVGVWGCYYSFL